MADNVIVDFRTDYAALINNRAAMRKASTITVIGCSLAQATELCAENGFVYEVRRTRWYRRWGCGRARSHEVAPAMVDAIFRRLYSRDHTHGRGAALPAADVLIEVEPGWDDDRIYDEFIHTSMALTRGLIVRQGLAKDTR